MSKYTALRKYLSFGIVWERTDSASKFKEAIVGTLFHIEEAVVVGEKVTYLYILSDVAADVYKWNAAEVRVVPPPGSRHRKNGVEDDEEDYDEEGEEGE